MLIAIDVGNTTCSLARFAADEIIARRTLSTATLKIPDLIKALNELQATAPGAASPLVIAIASVVPDTTSLLTQAAESISPAPAFIHLLDNATSEIIPHTLDRIATTGVDRLLAARGAISVTNTTPDSGLIVIQIGSAITLDAIDAQRSFRGGMIIPGAQMWLDALATAARLPPLSASDINWATHDLGTNTTTALLSGLAAALPAAVAAATDALRASGVATSWDTPFITGGGAEILAPHLGFTTRHAPDLVLRGIHSLIHDRISKKD